MSRVAESAVLHSDSRLIAVDKPPGEPVIPARAEPPEACLWRRLERRFGSRFWVVHRIDREASGVVVFARTPEAHRELCLAFEERRVRKRYLAFTLGALEPAAGSIELAIHDARKGKSRPASPGEPGSRAARSDYAVERVWRGSSVAIARVEVSPVTGRRHQIRVHLRASGVPILGDRLYGRSIDLGEFSGAPCTRLALHASRVTLPGLAGAGPLEIHAPLAADLVVLEDWLDSRG